MLGMFILTSCYTVSTMETEILRPAKYVFKPEVFKVGAVSRMDLEYRRTTGRIDKEDIERFERDSTILKNGVLGLLDGFAESPRFEAFKTAPPRVLKGRESILSMPLSWDLVDSLTGKDDLDILVCLAATNYRDTVARPLGLFKKDIDNGASTMNDGNNDVIRDDMKNSNQISYIMFPKIYWRIYEVDNRKVSEKIQEDTLIFDPGPVRGYPTTKETISIFTEAVGYMGYEFSRELAPYWMTVLRAWYIDGNYLFRKAAELANDGDWLQASEIWREMAYDENRRVASRASFNMALASEMMDEFEIAVDWVNRSKELGLDYYPDFYLKVLKKRIEEKQALDLQMKMN
jgi:hypothetical protein